MKNYIFSRCLYFRDIHKEDFIDQNILDKQRFLEYIALLKIFIDNGAICNHVGTKWNLLFGT